MFVPVLVLKRLLRQPRTDRRTSVDAAWATVASLAALLLMASPLGDQDLLVPPLFGQRHFYDFL